MALSAHGRGAHAIRVGLAACHTGPGSDSLRNLRLRLAFRCSRSRLCRRCKAALRVKCPVVPGSWPGRASQWLAPMAWAF